MTSRTCIAELERFSNVGISREGVGSAALTGDQALALMRLRPPSWDAERSFFTLEGDPVAQGSAIWSVRDVRKARERFRLLGGLGPRDPLEIDITMRRTDLVAGRPELPRGALVFEAAMEGDLDNASIATLRLEGERLSVEAMSEPRLEHAIEIVASDFGELVELADCEVIPIERALAEREPSPLDEHRFSGLAPTEERRLAEDFMTERMRRWLDEPHPQLGGSTPRSAAAGERRDEVVRLVRGIENTVERGRRDSQPRPDVGWLRGELGLDEPAA